MAKWLFKSEPSTFSWADLMAKSDVGEEWDGVRNYQARNFMRDMAVGDFGFFYHSQKEKAIVGVVEVITGVHQDSTTNDARWECVDIKAVKPVKRPITLEMIKSDGRLDEMILLRNSRLSVQSVRGSEWQIICDLAGVAP